MELNNSIDALVDRIVLSDIVIEDVYDLSELERKNIAIVSRDEKKNLYTTSSEQHFSSLTLSKCTLFDRFRARIGYKDGMPYFYTRLELSISRDDYTYNLNCWTITEIRERLAQIDAYLREELGILVNMDHVKIKSIEINKTICLNGEYDSYQRALKTMIQILPGNKRKKLAIVDNTYYAGNNREQIKIYDKTEQINEKRNKEPFCIERIADNYLRFELTLDEKRIQYIFGSREFCWFDDESINEYFNRFIEENIVRQWLSFREDLQKRLTKIVKEEWGKDARLFKENILLRCFNDEDVTGKPLMMTIDDLWVPLGKVCKGDRFKRSRLRHAIIDKCRDSYGERFVNNDEVKIKEIIDKLRSQYEVYDPFI